MLVIYIGTCVHWCCYIYLAIILFTGILLPAMLLS
jgi:hypothetical protein